MVFLYTLAWLWSLPTEIVGIVWMFAYCRPDTVEWRDGILTVRVGRLPMNARGETFGRLMLLCPREGEPVDIEWPHERVHVKQCDIFGPLWGPLYGLAYLWAKFEGGDGYRDNFFERWAREESHQE